MFCACPLNLPNMKISSLFRCLGLALACMPLALRSQPAGVPAEYNITWTSQSENSGDSMPCVGGDIGLNAWVENDELLFYIGRAGCRDENGSLLKMGRVRMSIDPSPFSKDAEFSQTLNLQTGAVEIHAKQPGGNEATIRLWVEVARPIIHVEIDTVDDSLLEVTYETWRHQRIELPNTRKNLHRGQCLIHYDNYPEPVFVEADDFRPNKNAIRFWHRMDEERNVFNHLVKTQGLEEVKSQLIDPCRHLIFGGELIGRSDDQPLALVGQVDGEYALTPFQGWRYRSQQKAKAHRVDVITHIEQAEDLKDWHESLTKVVVDVRDSKLTAARAANQTWWDEFWSRSYIHINPGRSESDTGWRLGRNYALFRYMLASGLSEREPIMFNGGVLTFDPIYAGERFKGRGYTPDHRQWGGALTAQNQRCMYWPMLKSGDLDLLKPGFNYYRDGLNNTRVRTRHYWGHDGCSFTEQITIPWLPGAMVYGYAGERFKGKTWRYRPDETETGVCVNQAVSRIYEGQLEWSYMILEHHRFTGADISEYLPFIEQSVIFYDEHYRMREKQRSGQELTDTGKLHITPTNTLEGHPKGANPTSVIAGIESVLTGLIPLSKDTDKQKRWTAMLDTLPEKPTAMIDGREVLVPTTEHKSFSWHMPSMYALYPYQRYTLGKPGLKLMRDTYLYSVTEKQRMDHRAWIQGVVHFAHLGMKKEAEELIIRKLDSGPYRFPSFWPPDIDHAPDHNWGGMAMIGLQEMLMQTGDDRILLMPAWPEDWEVNFKLHAPYETVIEGSIQDGRLIKRKVTPEGREKAIVIWASPASEP